MQLLHDSTMAEGGPDHEHVDQLLTPVSAMHISPSASRRFRVNKETVSPTGGTPVSKRVSARTQFSSRKRLSFSPVPTEASSGSSAPLAGPWTDAETKALLDFLLFHRGPETTWCRRDCDRDFWRAASRFVQTRSKTELPRTGIAIQS